MDPDDPLDELSGLLTTAGGIEAGRFQVVRRRPDPATYIGRGKVEVLAAEVNRLDADLVVFDDELSASQVAQLEKGAGVRVIDRSALILDIFAHRARSREARTQVELARLNYLLPRLTRRWTHLGRQKGGIGLRGEGETQLEVDRRLLRQRISRLRRELRGIDRSRSERRNIQVDVRVIAATNRDLEAETKAGRFREDLYYRLRVLPVAMPPLRDRTGDVPMLVKACIDAFNREFKKSVRGVAAEVLAGLEAYAWPGNVRELKNAVERAMILADGDTLSPVDFPMLDVPAEPTGAFRLPPAGIDIAELERDLVEQALERTAGNQTRAAALLGMNRDQIRYRIEKYGLARPTDAESRRPTSGRPRRWGLARQVLLRSVVTRPEGGSVHFSQEAPMPTQKPAATTLGAATPQAVPPEQAGTCAQKNGFDILAHCHEHILGKLAVLEETARALRHESAFSDALLASFCDVLVFLDTALSLHTADEEQSLFPRLRRCQPFMGNEGDTPMDCMESEHKQHQRMLAVLKRAIMQREVLPVANASVALVNEYRTHIGKENEILFPWAKELLADPADVAEMTREMQARREAVSLKSC